MTTTTESAPVESKPFPKGKAGPLEQGMQFLGSFGLACALLMFLFVLVLAATFGYGTIGEAGVKQKFFIPWIAWIDGPFGWTLPWPGGTTVFGLNLKLT